jgi:hypothetical protein
MTEGSSLKDAGARRVIGYHFDPGEGFLLVQVNKDAYGYVDKAVRYQSKTFAPKTELHITILSADGAEQVRQQIEEHPEDEGRIVGIIDHTDWSFIKLDEYYHVKDGDEETIIQMVEVPRLNAFFSDLSALVGKGFVLPPTHVTLYMRESEKGIGLPNREVFDELVQGRVSRDALEWIEDQQEEGGGQ